MPGSIAPARTKVAKNISAQISAIDGEDGLGGQHALTSV